jgi:hypothetical protein
MKISLLSTVLALAAISAAAPTDSALEAVMRREALLLERAGVNGNRPVAIGRCCVVATSLKQDVCTTASGATGVCLPLGASSNCKGFSFNPGKVLMGFR